MSTSTKSTTEGSMPRLTTAERFMAKVSKKPTGCWEWTAYINPKGYGIFYWDKKIGGAHRYALEQKLGIRLSSVEFACHHCDNPPCVNPDHLFLGDNSANVQDSIRKGRNSSGNAKKSHCKRGHGFTEENTRINPRGERVCKICDKELQEERRQKSYEEIGKPAGAGVYVRMPSSGPYWVAYIQVNKEPIYLGQFSSEEEANAAYEKAKTAAAETAQPRAQMKPKNNATGYMGVLPAQTKDRWMARTHFTGNRVHIGTFDSKEEAARAYDQKVIEFYGKNTLYLNFPEEYFGVSDESV